MRRNRKSRLIKTAFATVGGAIELGRKLRKTLQIGFLRRLRGESDDPDRRNAGGLAEKSSRLIGSEPRELGRLEKGRGPVRALDQPFDRFGRSAGRPKRKWTARMRRRSMAL